MHDLLIASANPGKVHELRQALATLHYTVRSLADIGFTEEIPETGTTYEENARIKAETIGKQTHLLTLADDSGIEVDALDGRPGVYSARYVAGSDADRLRALLKEMEGVAPEQRTARYQAVIALYIPEQKQVQTFSGSCEGRITVAPVGNHGFGYDPIFYSFDLQKTFGEATEEEKQRVSHRARALAKAKAYLTALV